MYDASTSGTVYKSHALRCSYLVLMAIVLLATGLRFYWLEDQSLWYDEGFSIALAKLPWSKTITWTAQDVHPPLYYLLLNLWMKLCGDSAWAVRTFSALFGIATLPLIYVLGRRVLNEKIGLIAALLAMLSPLYVYYSREARMYALLTFLSLLSSYALLRITDEYCTKKRHSVLWTIYLLTSLAIAYVHYFALFVLATHAIYFGVWWLRKGRPSRSGRQAAAVAILWVLGYSPWYPILLNSFTHYSGYWQGSMPVLLALRHIFISFSVGEMIPEPAAWYVTMGYIALLVVSALLLFLSLKKRSVVHPLPFLWLYLVLPLTLMSYLYSRKPKVTPRYSMLVSPPFILLISAALVGLWGYNNIKLQRLPSLMLRFFAIAAACFVLTTASYADYSLFFTSSLRKPDFRATVRYVCQECASDEAIVLISGHMFPIFDYYCPGHERYPIPDDPVLHVENVVNLDVTETLQKITAGKSGVWLVLWQDDIVDPYHIVLDLLLSQGTELPTLRAFHGIGLRHIQLSPEATFIWESTVTLPVNACWQHGINLVEARINKLFFHHGETLQLTLYWRTEMPLKESYTVFTHVARGETHTQHDGLPANGTRPTYTWGVGEIIEDRHVIGIPSWLPSGEYELQVGLYNYAAEGMPRLSVIDEAGREIDNYAILSRVRVLPHTP